MSPAQRRVLNHLSDGFWHATPNTIRAAQVGPSDVYECREAGWIRTERGVLDQITPAGYAARATTNLDVSTMT